MDHIISEAQFPDSFFIMSLIFPAQNYFHLLIKCYFNLKLWLTARLNLFRIVLRLLQCQENYPGDLWTKFTITILFFLINLKY